MNPRTPQIALFMILLMFAFTSLVLTNVLEGSIASTGFVIGLATSTAIIGWWAAGFLTGGRALPTLYSVAIIGFRESGKTTLVTTLFDEIFNQRVEGIIRSAPRGTSVIERVNRDIHLLEQGHALGPTTDQDRFAYRTDLTLKGFPFPRTLRVEFGDFPGEDSKKYTEAPGPWLHNTEFFKWVAESDAGVFVIDTALWMLDDGYASEMTASIRAAWQYLVGTNEHRQSGMRNYRVVLAFTKVDAMIRPVETAGVEYPPFVVSGEDLRHVADWRLELERLTRNKDTVPKIREVDKLALAKAEGILAEAFKDLIRYMESETRHCSVVLTSSLAKVGGKRVGMAELLSAVLPVAD